MDVDLVKVAIVVGAILFSASFHEASHALIADKLGDSTGRSLGRITLNPIKHMDLFMSIIFPALLLIASHGQFAFGGAKPVPINPYAFQKPARDFALSAAAGPVSNFILCGLCLFVLYVFTAFAPDFVRPDSYNAYLFGQLVILNIILAVFNLIPIPPLDGSRVFRLILPYNLQSKYDEIERFGVFILLALLMFTDISRVMISPFLHFIVGIMNNVLGGRYTYELLRNLQSF
ncbi:MAG: site-2 protease family protein [Planctomycetes bacterium]|nr:site-2 protease family protein [Planctomycetota bacterium]